MSEMRSEGAGDGDEDDIMSHMVACAGRVSASLADVLPSCLAATGVEGFSNTLDLPATDSIVLFLIDGLGRRNLEAARGHSRYLSQTQPAAALETVFPSTTASALASLVTGVQPGSHGIGGYRIWHPAKNELVNQLTGITVEDAQRGWLASPSLVAQLADSDTPVTVVGHPRFASSPLTRLLYGNTPYIGVASIADKFRVLARNLRELPGVTLVYISDLDETAHRAGVESREWCDLLEELDHELVKFAKALPSSTHSYLTADHGIVDVPSTEHVEFGLGQEMRGVRAIGGEPRCLQVYLDGTFDASEVALAWSQLSGDPALVVHRDDIAERWWSGAIAENVRGRLPDFYVFAPAGCAWYDARDPLAPARGMIGQHGGISPEEREIPFLAIR